MDSPKASGSVRVVVVDDFEPWHRFVSTQLGKKAELTIIGRAFDGLEAVRQIEDLQPDLVLLDIQLPTLNGIEAARRIRKLSPSSKILFVSENRSSDVAKEALRAGGCGYVFKSNAASELLPAIEAVLRGKAFLSVSLTCRDMNAEARNAVSPARNEKVVLPSGPQSFEIKAHELSLYPDDAALVCDFAHSIAAALDNEDQVVVVATESQRAGIVQALGSEGADVASATERNLYVALGGADTHSTFREHDSGVLRAAFG